MNGTVNDMKRTKRIADNKELPFFFLFQMNDAVSDMILVSKEDGNIVPYQPETVGDLVEFKRKYPNAQAIIVKTSEQK
jgi:hypothetical protein